MAEAGWPRHAVRVGVFEFRRSARSMRENTVQLALLSLGVLGFTVMIAGFGILLSDAIGGVAGTGLPAQLRGTVGLFWLFGVYIVAQRVSSARSRVEAEPLMLTTVSTRTVAVGLAVAELLRLLAYVGLPVLTASAVLAYAVGTPAFLLTVPVAVLLFGATAVVVGSCLGYAVALLLVVSPFVARHKTVLAVPVVLVFFGGYFLIQMPQFSFVSEAALSVLPPSWFADLAVVGTPIDGSLVRAGGAVAGSLALLGVGGWVLVRVAAALWFSDGAADGPTSEGRSVAAEAPTDDAATSAESALAAAISPVAMPNRVGLPTRRVAEMTLLRTRRNPRRLSFLVMPIVAFGVSLVSGGGGLSNPLAVLPAVCAVVVPWLAGAAFTLNPLGDEGSVLPVTLVAARPVQYVRGLVLPGLLAGLPLAVALTVLTGLVSPYSPTAVALLAVLAAGLTVAASLLGVAVGTRLPRFSAISVGKSDEVLPPRFAAAALHVVAVAVPGALLASLVVAPTFARVAVSLVGYVPGALLALLAGVTVESLSAVAEPFLALGAAVRALNTAELRVFVGGPLVVAGILVPSLAYRYALRRFEAFEPT